MALAGAWSAAPAALASVSVEDGGSWPSRADTYFNAPGGEDTFDFIQTCYSATDETVTDAGFDELAPDGTPIDSEGGPVDGGSPGCTNAGQIMWQDLSEGAHTYQSWATGSVSGVVRAAPYTVYIDRTPPGTVSDLVATFDPDTSTVDVAWDDAPDPDLPTGEPGAGIDSYQFRYQTDGSAWSGWQWTNDNDVSLADGHDGEQVEFEIQAVDTAGNEGDVAALGDVAAESTLTVDDPGDTSAEEPTDIGFSSDPEPDQGDGDGSQPAARLAAPSYTEHNCDDDANPCGHYDGAAAARYARYWFHRRNNAYASYGNDCTDFISEALTAGGMRFMRTDGHQDTTPSNGDYLDHYHRGLGSFWSARQIDARGRYYWEESRSFTVAQSSYDRMIDFGVGRRLYSPERPQPGDIVYYDLKGSAPNWTHSSIVTKVTRTAWTVAQHTDDYQRPFADVRRHLNEKYGPLGQAWTYVVVRPIHTMFNLDQ